MRRCWTTTMAENPKMGEVILHFLEAPILGNLISPAKLPTRLTFDVGQTLRTIDRLPNNSWPLRVTLQTSRWRAHSAPADIVHCTPTDRPECCPNPPPESSVLIRKNYTKLQDCRKLRISNLPQFDVTPPNWMGSILRERSCFMQSKVRSLDSINILPDLETYHHCVTQV